jgi:hypothetical protein
MGEASLIDGREGYASCAALQGIIRYRAGARKLPPDQGRWLTPLMGNGPNYLPGGLILPLTLIGDRPQKAALCPGQVCHFHDHFRPDPMHI